MEAYGILPPSLLVIILAKPTAASGLIGTTYLKSLVKSGE